jgi:anti-sigma factor RsiW
MSCAAPEGELLSFYAAGTLSDAERAAVERHVADCASCREDLQLCRDLLTGLGQLHLTAEEIVAVAWGEAPSGHVDECPRCRDEVARVRAVNATLRPSRAAQILTRPGLAWAAAVLLALPAALYVKEHLSTAVPPVTRGPADRVVGFPVNASIVVAPDASTSLPRTTVLLAFTAPAPAAGERIEVDLRGPAGDLALHAPDLAVAEGVGRIVVDTRELAAGTWTLSVRRMDAQGVPRETRRYVLTVS